MASTPRQCTLGTLAPLLRAWLLSLAVGSSCCPLLDKVTREGVHSSRQTGILSSFHLALSKTETLLERSTLWWVSETASFLILTKNSALSKSQGNNLKNLTMCTQFTSLYPNSSCTYLPQIHLISEVSNSRLTTSVLFFIYLKQYL